MRKLNETFVLGNVDLGPDSIIGKYIFYVLQLCIKISIQSNCINLHVHAHTLYSCVCFLALSQKQLIGKHDFSCE